MPLKSVLETFSFGFLVGGAVYGLIFAAFWIDEEIEELNSRLEDCEDELKK